MKTYALYDIVDKMVGGSIVPVGETNCDNKAFTRMLEVEELVEDLIDDFSKVVETDGTEYSIQRARVEAGNWLEDLRDKINDVIGEK